MKIEADVLGSPSPSLVVRTVRVNVKEHQNKKKVSVADFRSYVKVEADVLGA